MFSESKVFVVDADDRTYNSINALVPSSEATTDRFASAEAFLESFDDSQVGCLVTGLLLPGISGVELLEKLGKQEKRLPSILLINEPDLRVTVRAMKAGALNVLEKPCRDHELWDAIREGLKKSDQRRKTHRIDNHEVHRRMANLTKEERHVMELVVSGNLNKRIANELNIGLRTVELRRHNVMKKMEATSIAELVRLALLAKESASQE